MTETGRLQRSHAGIWGIGFALTAFLAFSASAEATIVGISSNVSVTIGAPPSGTDVTSNFLITGGLTPAIAFNEQQGVLLANPLVTDTGTIAARTVVDSQYVAFNDTVDQLQSTTVTFDGSVLGIVFLSGSAAFAGTDFLGLSALIYNDNCANCGYESGDTATFAGNQAFLNSDFSEPGDFARIITAAASPVPEPGTLSLLAAALLGLFAASRRRA